MFCEPHTQKLEGGDDHGVEVAGLEGSRPAALVHDVATYGADGSFPVGRVHPHLHLDRNTKVGESANIPQQNTRVNTCALLLFTFARPASSSRAAREMLMSCLHWEFSRWVTRWMLRTSRPAAVSARARPYDTPKYQTPQRTEQSKRRARQGSANTAKE